MSISPVRSSFDPNEKSDLNESRLNTKDGVHLIDIHSIIACIVLLITLLHTRLQTPNPFSAIIMADCTRNQRRYEIDLHLLSEINLPRQPGPLSDADCVDKYDETENPGDVSQLRAARKTCDCRGASR